MIWDGRVGEREGHFGAHDDEGCLLAVPTHPVREEYHRRNSHTATDEQCSRASRIRCESTADWAKHTEAIANLLFRQ